MSCTTALIVNDGISLEEKSLCLQEHCEAPVVGVSDYPMVFCNESAEGYNNSCDNSALNSESSAFLGH